MCWVVFKYLPLLQSKQRILHIEILVVHLFLGVPRNANPLCLYQKSNMLQTGILVDRVRLFHYDQRLHVAPVLPAYLEERVRDLTERADLDIPTLRDGCQLKHTSVLGSSLQITAP